MKKILVLTDFSDCAGLAVSAALDIAQTNEAYIHFLHCKSVPYNWIQFSDFPNKLYQDVSQEVKEINVELDNLVKKAAEKGVKATESICFDENNHAVVQYINKNDIDFVMMGSHGAHGLKEAFVGSNAQKVVRYSDVPVFVVKKELNFKRDSRIVFISDFEHEMLEPFDRVFEFVKMIGAKLDLVYINTPSFFTESWEVKNRMESFILKSGMFLNKTEIVDAENFERGIESYCYNLDNSIIAMATHGRTGITRLLTGSKTEDVINHIDKAILSLHVQST